MDKLKTLLNRCKCGVFVTVNQHRDYYQSVDQALDDLAGMESPPEIPADIRAEMVRKDTIVEVQFYPDTPIGFYLIYHYDIDLALDEALACL